MKLKYFGYPLLFICIMWGLCNWNFPNHTVSIQEVSRNVPSYHTQQYIIRYSDPADGSILVEGMIDFSLSDDPQEEQTKRKIETLADACNIELPSDFEEYIVLIPIVV